MVFSWPSIVSLSYALTSTLLHPGEWFCRCVDLWSSLYTAHSAPALFSFLENLSPVSPPNFSRQESTRFLLLFVFVCCDLETFAGQYTIFRLEGYPSRPETEIFSWLYFLSLVPFSQCLPIYGDYDTSVFSGTILSNKYSLDFLAMLSVSSINQSIFL